MITFQVKPVRRSLDSLCSLGMTCLVGSPLNSNLCSHFFHYIRISLKRQGQLLQDLFQILFPEGGVVDHQTPAVVRRDVTVVVAAEGADADPGPGTQGHQVGVSKLRVDLQQEVQACVLFPDGELAGDGALQQGGNHPVSPLAKEILEGKQ